MKDAQHWSDDKMMLYGRAHLKASSDKVRLILEPVLREDEAVYKCRVDFKKSPTRHYRIHLAVISKSNVALRARFTPAFRESCAQRKRAPIAN